MTKRKKDLHTALDELAELVAQRRLLDQRIADAVAVVRGEDLYRGHRATWEDVGTALGVTRQAAAQRYGV